VDKAREMLGESAEEEEEEGKEGKCSAERSVTTSQHTGVVLHRAWRAFWLRKVFAISPEA
jgi:hypothetical protein